MVKPQILIVEDNSIVAEGIKDSLEKFGYVVAGIESSGENALKITEEKRPDLVLMDIVLKGEMDGIEAAGYIRSRFGIPVVFLTAYADEEKLERAKITMPFGYLIKPFQDRELKVTIEMALYNADIDAECKQAKVALQRAHDELEQRIAERTKELERINEELHKDNTERKKVEKALEISKRDWEKTFNAISDWICLLDKDNTVTRTNQMGSEMLDTPLEQIVGRKCCELIHGTEDPIEGCPFEKTKKAHKRETSEIYFPDKDRWLLISIDPFFDEKGNLTGAVHMARDITDRKQTEETLSRAQKLESVGILAGGIAHDFNNLLAVILGNVSMAKEDVTNGDTLEFLNDAEEASLKAKRLTHQLITFSKGGEPVKKIAPMVEFAKKSANLALSGSNVRCESALPDDLWLVEYDENHLEHVIDGLIKNAVEAMPEGGIIKLFAENLMVKEGKEARSLNLQKGKYVKISIQDQGAGISEENLPRIFEPYFSTKDRGDQKGMGLGLATAHSIISKHKGHISVDSKKDVGTTFHVYLPAFEEKGSQKDFAEDRSVPIEQELLSGSKSVNGQSSIKRVLVMDDEASLRNLVKRMLSRFGYEAGLARDGVEAIALYKEALKAGQRFDAVILDLTIKGGMGGEQTIKELIKIDPDVNAIISSAYFDDPVMANFRDYGFRRAMPKPYETDTLGKTLG